GGAVETWLRLMWEKMLEQGRGKGRKRVAAVTMRARQHGLLAADGGGKQQEVEEDVGEEMGSDKGAATLLIQVEKKASATATMAMWAAGGDGEEQRPRWRCRAREAEGQQHLCDRQQRLWQKHDHNRGKKKSNSASVSATVAGDRWATTNGNNGALGRRLEREQGKKEVGSRDGRGIAVVAAKSTMTGKGNDTTGGGGR
ncbi:hypothetical protein BHM03_00027190, partial [Ensete ventricosum]